MPLTDNPMEIPVFIFYADNDNQGSDPSKLWLDRLLEQLHAFIPENKRIVWPDPHQENSSGWKDPTFWHILNVKVAVLLVSPALLASKSIRNGELPVRLMNAMKEGVTIIPIILRHCLFAETKFKYPDPSSGPEEFSLSVFHSFNSPSNPLNMMQEQDQDSVLRDVALGIANLLGGFENSKPAPDQIIDDKLLQPTWVDEQGNYEDHLYKGSRLADALIVWDPAVVDHEDYVTLITALGDLVRSQGGIGVERIGHLGIELPVSEDILI